MEIVLNCNSFLEISNRGRIAYAICCLENAMEHYKEKSKGWDFVLENLWTFCNQNMAIWQEKIGEMSPFSICDNSPFEQKGCEYISMDIHNDLKKLYSKSNEVLLKLVDEIYELGITNLYVVIITENQKKRGLPYLQNILDILNKNKIQIPDFNNFQQFPIHENNGWGREFTKEDVFK